MDDNEHSSARNYPFWGSGEVVLGKKTFPYSLIFVYISFELSHETKVVQNVFKDLPFSVTFLTLELDYAL